MYKLSRNQKGFSTIELLIVVIVLAIIGGVGCMVYRTHHTTKINSATQVSNQTTAYSSNFSAAIPLNSNPINVYQNSPSTNLLITDSKQNTLAKINQNIKNGHFMVDDNNGEYVLIEDTYQGNPQGIAYLVNNKGTITNIPRSIMTNLSGGGGDTFNMYLGYKNNAITNDCPYGQIGDSGSPVGSSYAPCTLKNVNLLNGQSKTIAVISSNVSPSPLDVLGITPENVIYDLNYSKGLPYFEERDLNTNKVTVSIPLKNAPSDPSKSSSVSLYLSNNFNYVAYHDDNKSNGNLLDILNLSDNKKLSVETQCNNNGSTAVVDNVIWSPNDGKIAYSCTIAKESAANTWATNTNLDFLDYVNVADSMSKILFNPGNNQVNQSIYTIGWTSEDDILYTYTPVINGLVSTHNVYSSVNTTSDKATQNPAPSGYYLLTSSDSGIYPLN
jgi:hypothetical protein